LPDLGDLPSLDGPQSATRGPDAPVVDAEPIAEQRPAPARSEVTEEFAVGATIAGRYRLDKLIGEGGMAMVFRARDLELEEDVALKVFTLQITSETAVARFKQELKLSRQLVHPNIIRLYDIGLHAGHRYISMELLRAESLKQRIQRPMPFTGAPPFTHAELVPLLMMHVNQAPEPPRKKNPAVPEEIERVILRLLAKDPARRHPSCGALADELLRIKQNLPR